MHSEEKEKNEQSKRNDLGLRVDRRGKRFAAITEEGNCERCFDRATQTIVAHPPLLDLLHHCQRAASGRRAEVTKHPRTS
jgi:hypothetical protein